MGAAGVEHCLKGFEYLVIDVQFDKKLPFYCISCAYLIVSIKDPQSPFSGDDQPCDHLHCDWAEPVEVAAGGEQVEHGHEGCSAEGSWGSDGALKGHRDEAAPDAGDGGHGGGGRSLALSKTM